MNISNILKYCPEGTKLYSLIEGEVTLVNVDKDEKYPIEVNINRVPSYYTKDGLFFIDYPNGECVLFPSKEQRDWNQFRIPVKKGDIMMKIDGTSPFIATGEIHKDISPMYICGINTLGNFQIGFNEGGWTSDFYIPASKKVKKKLFDKIKEAGYKWNADTLELEKIEPKFKPFDKVLVKNQTNEKWSINLFSYYNKEDKIFPYVCLDGKYHYCVPYEGNEELINTSKNFKE